MKIRDANAQELKCVEQQRETVTERLLSPENTLMFTQATFRSHVDEPEINGRAQRVLCDRLIV